MDTRDEAVAAVNAHLDFDDPREVDAETDRWMIHPFLDAWVIGRCHRRALGVTLYMVLDGHVQMFTLAHTTYEQTYRQMLLEVRRSTAGSDDDRPPTGGTSRSATGQPAAPSPAILSSRLQKVGD